MKIIIPARKGSKGLPGKNVKLFDYTIKSIPESFRMHVHVLTDDDRIVEKCKNWGIDWKDRPESVSNDTASTKSLINWYIQKFEPQETLLVLYLTYPERTWEEIARAISLFRSSDAPSLLCKKSIETSPFLILKEEPGLHGSQLFFHDLYRRQDYPKCFEISHFICLINPKLINSLNNNLYSRDTIFMSIDEGIIDVDTEKDFKRLNGLSE